MTKSTRQDTLQEFIGTLIPKTMDLSIKSNKTGKTYETGLNEGITIPVGEYKVNGVSMDRSGTMLFGNRVSISQIPSIVTNTDVKILKGVDKYKLDANLNCFGIVVDLREIERVEMTADRIYNQQLSFNQSENYGIVFVNGELGNQITFTIYPKDLDNYTSKELKMSGSRGNGVFVEQGKYYIIHPYKVDNENAGFDMQLPLMQEIELK